MWGSFFHYPQSHLAFEVIVHVEIKSLSTREQGRRDTCHLTDFFQTIAVYEAH